MPEWVKLKRSGLTKRDIPGWGSFVNRITSQKRGA